MSFKGPGKKRNKVSVEGFGELLNGIKLSEEKWKGSSVC